MNPHVDSFLPSCMTKTIPHFRQLCRTRPYKRSPITWKSASRFLAIFSSNVRGGPPVVVFIYDIFRSFISTELKCPFCFASPPFRFFLVYLALLIRFLSVPFQTRPLPLPRRHFLRYGHQRVHASRGVDAQPLAPSPAPPRVRGRGGIPAPEAVHAPGEEIWPAHCDVAYLLGRGNVAESVFSPLTSLTFYCPLLLPTRAQCTEYSTATSRSPSSSASRTRQVSPHRSKMGNRVVLQAYRFLSL